jgi:tetratricopeptide (TPR) repeat protein
MVKAAKAATRKPTAKAARARSNPNEPGVSKDNKAVYYAAAGLLVLVVACYANGLYGQFVFDDTALVLWQRWPQSFDEAVRLLRYGYRPLRELSYAIDIVIWGQNPVGFHLTSLLLHAVNVLLVFKLAQRLLIKLLPAAAAASIFALHPIQTESVTYISGRRDVLFALFYLAAFHMYLRWRSAGRYRDFGLFVVCWVLSLMSKEMAVSLPLVVLAWNFVELSGEPKTGSAFAHAAKALAKSLWRDKWLYAPLIVAMLGYTWYYVFVKQSSSRVSEGGVYFWGGSYYSNLLMAVRAQAWYLKQLVFPTPIAQYYGAFEPSYSITEWKVLVSIVVIGAVLALGFALLRKNRVMSFAVFAYFAMLAPVSQIIPHHEFAADHYLYLPLAMFAVFIAAGVDWLVERWPAAFKPAWSAVGAGVLILGLMTVLTNRTWANEFTLWQANYESVPNSPRAAANLGTEYRRSRGDVQKAEFYYKQALASDPAFEPVYPQLVELYMSLKRYDKAEEVILQGLEVAEAGRHSFLSIRKPSLFRAQLLSSLGAVKKAQGDTAAAVPLLQESIALQPDNLEPYAVLANMYHGSEPQKEIEVLRAVLGVKPYYYELVVRVLSLLVETRQYDQAVIYANRALAFAPTENDCNKASGYLDTARKFAGLATSHTSLQVLLERIAKQCGK